MSKGEQAMRFATDRKALYDVTKAVCPELLSNVSSDEPRDVTCENHHLQVILSADVLLRDTNGVPLKSVDMKIANSAGEESVRTVDFTINHVMPYYAGGRLGDVLDRESSFKSIINRYAAYTSIAPQLVEAVKTMHKVGLSHLGIDGSSILCTNTVCDNIVLTEFSRSLSKNRPQAFANSMYTSEVSQSAVRFMGMDNSTSDEADKDVLKLFSKYAKSPVTWESIKKVDWYSVGGTLFYVINGFRHYGDALDNTTTNSHASAVFIIKTLGDKALLSKLKGDTKALSTVNKLRDHVAEGLLLVDGLLSPDRTKRLTFDTEEQRAKIASSFRSNKLAMSALQTEGVTNACTALLEESRLILPDADRTKTLPSFLQNMC